MCGIAGIWHRNGRKLDRAVLDKFTDSLAHRGPDGRGVFLAPIENLGLGHRRLAILDLSESGAQPMAFGNGRYHLTFNGEIYNFLELRRELEGHGHRFRSDSDSEVILAAYVQWGEACQLRFNGMWAFAIWDTQERTLFLSRDRFGVKPLHYCESDGRFAFASEMKAFLALEGFDVKFSDENVSRALHQATSLEATEGCLLQGIRRLPGGHCLTVGRSGPPRLRRWWNTLEHRQAGAGNFKQQTAEFRELFFDACRIRMRSDVPVGTALSGGLDSSAVLCSLAFLNQRRQVATRSAPQWQKAMVATFPGTGQDESAFARQVVEHTGADPVYKIIDPAEALDHLDDLIFQFEEIYDLPVAPWLIYRELRNHGIVVSLDGHGGDELLAGYHHYPALAMSEAAGQWPWGPMRLPGLRRTLASLYPEGAQFQMPNTKTLIWQEAQQRLRGTAIHRILRSLRGPRTLVHAPSEKSFPPGWLLQEFAPAPMNAWVQDSTHLQDFDALGRALYFDFHYGTLPTILRNFDRVSMAHGVEIRAPFLDWRLVCLGFGLPSSSKLGKGYSKRILRQSMSGLMPDAVRLRRDKIGFRSPLADWARGGMRSYILDLVNSRQFLDSLIWDGPQLRFDIEDSFARGEFSIIDRAWPYIQASRLMDLFGRQP